MSEAVSCDFCGLPVPLSFRGRAAADESAPLYCCYGCHFAAQVTRSRGESGQAGWMLTRLGIAVFLSMGVMVFSLAGYGQEIYGGTIAEAAKPAVTFIGLFRYLALAMATPVFFLLGVPIFTNAVTQGRRGVVSTDALVVIGVAAAIVYSYVSTLTDSGAVYYETACMVLVLITVGRYLEATGKLRASASVTALDRLMPDEVAVRRGDESLTIPAAEVRLDDRFVVPAGERIGADGCVEAGTSHVDEQLLTGESTPVVRQVGDTVRGGTLNLDGALTVRATAVGSQSALGRLTAMLDAAKRAKGRFERLADRVAAIFVPLTVGMAALAAVLGYRRGSLDEAIMSALAVLLIACPCALGIATPMAIWVALGRAAAGQVLFRNGEAIEALAGVRAVAFDKTGTLTSGEPVVEAFTAATDEQGALSRTLMLAAGVAATSMHAASRSVVTYARREGIAFSPAGEVRTVPGRGLVGTVDGVTVRLGNVAMMREADVTFDDVLEQRAQTVAADGRSIVCVGVDGDVAGVFALGESLRAEASEAVAVLVAEHLRVEVLTGDHAERGAIVARQLSVPTSAELGPDDKLRHLDRLRRECGAVAMVGDGLNDAPALAGADVGVAMGCGADVARESAAVCLLGNDLRSVPWAITLAQRTVRTIRVNLFWAFFYNVIGMGLAVTGKLSPLFAAGAMVVSSLLVVTNSLRLGSLEEGYHGGTEASRSLRPQPDTAHENTSDPDIHHQVTKTPRH